MSRRKLLLVPALAAAAALFASPTLPASAGGSRAEAADGVWTRLLYDLKGQVVCKEEGNECHVNDA